MTVDPERQRVEEDIPSASPTACENTPLLASETSSYITSPEFDYDQDACPDPEIPIPTPTQRQKPSPLGWKHASCIVVSMWALIFLQGASPIILPILYRILTDTLQQATCPA